MTGHGGELITLLSDESRKAISNILLRGQGLRMAPRDIAKDIRPLIGLTDRQAQANLKYKDVVYQKLLDNGMSEAKARERSEAAALRYAGKQHRYRAESIVLTENAFAYNRGAHMGVSQSIADGYMGRCEMVWTTAGTNRVCGRCMELKDTVVGYTDQSGVTIPPLHPRCRCTIMYREVGTPRVMQPKPSKLPHFSEAEFDLQRFGGQRLPEGDYNLTVRRQVQNRHIEGTEEYKNYVKQIKAQGKSFLPSKLSPNVNVQEIVNEFHGKGIYAPHPDIKQRRERVNTGRVIGQYWDYKIGGLVDTTWLMIVYSSKGTHVYPIHPFEEQ